MGAACTKGSSTSNVDEPANDQPEQQQQQQQQQQQSAASSAPQSKPQSTRRSSSKAVAKPVEEPEEEESGEVENEEGLDDEFVFMRALDLRETEMNDRQRKFDEQRAEAEAKMAAAETTETNTRELNFGVATETTVEEFMAIKPWEGQIVAPSSWSASQADPSAPDRDLKMKWVNGYRGFDQNDMAYVTKSGELAYPAAAIGVVYDPKAHTQRFFQGKTFHTNDIISCALSPDGTLCATGQLNRHPQICVWDVKTMQLVTKFQEHHQRGIVSLAFSPSGKLLASVGADTNHTVAVWDLKKKAAVAKGEFGQSYAPSRIIMTDEKTVMGACPKVVAFAQVAGASFTVRRGVFGQVPATTSFGLARKDENTAVAGTFGGHLYVFAGRAVDAKRSKMNAHKGPIYTVHYDAGSGSFYTGGKDGIVRRWTSSLSPSGEIDMNAVSHNKSVSVRSLHSNGSTLVIGLDTCELYTSDVNLSAPKLVTQGHFANETWGLAVHPTNDSVYVTGGDEGSLIVWNGETNRANAEAAVTGVTSGKDDGVRQLAFNHAGDTLAAGTRAGEIVIFKFDGKLHQSHRFSAAGTEISALKFSPNGEYLAVGSHDRVVAIYTTSNYEKAGVIKGHHATILHFDFSADSAYLQTNSRDYELLFWNVPDGSMVDASSVRDTEWDTFTCILGFPVQGIWPKYADGSDINAVSRSKDQKLVVTGDDMSRVSLFRYPCTVKGAKSNVGYGHASFVTCVRFSANDKYVYSTGGFEKTVVQWEVV